MTIVALIAQERCDIDVVMREGYLNTLESGSQGCFMDKGNFNIETEMNMRESGKKGGERGMGNALTSLFKVVI